MDKNAIKKYAVWARTELIERVSKKADEFEVSADADPKADSARGVLLTDTQKKQRAKLIAEVQEKGFEQVMEEVAYTWFNRFSALRFMEVNNYLPTRVRVFTDADGAFKPQILTEAIHMELKGLDMEKVYALKEANDDDALFKYLIITQCNALSDVLPGMFQRIFDYTELLFPDNLLRDGSVIEKMVTQGKSDSIPEEDWKDQIQIIGWLYQYYNNDQNELVYDGSMSKSRIPKELLSAATTIYTPDWPVRYMVENSLGRLWLEGHPGSRDELIPTDEERNAYSAGKQSTEDHKWYYYLDEAQQEPEVEKQLTEIRREYSALTPEQIRCIDPCSGSGHICAYLFDVLVQIYEAYGYTSREAVESIIKNNLYGLDIDERAAQLAYFSVMMKAVQYDPRFLRRKDENGEPNIPQPHVYAIKESNHLDNAMVEYFCNGDAKLTSAMNTLIDEMHDAKEYGSILNVKRVDFAALYARFDEVDREITIYREGIRNELLPFVQCAEAMAQKYHTVVTNPPYLGSSRFSAKMDKYVKDNYPTEKSDLSMVVYKRALSGYAAHDGFVAFITTSSWMNLASFEKLRTYLFANLSINSLVDYGTELFEGKVGHNPIVSWITRNTRMDYIMTAIRLVDYCYSRRDEKEPEYFDEHNRFSARQSNFSKIPGNPVAYQVSDTVFATFDNLKIGDFGNANNGFTTGDNDRFLRLWYEVKYFDINFNALTLEMAKNSGMKWFPYNKGGAYRKWYGNNDYIINWQDDGRDVKAYGHLVPRSMKFQFKKAISWSKISSSNASFKVKEPGTMFDVAGLSLFVNDEGKFNYLLALCDSTVCQHYLDFLSPTLNYETGHIASIPVIASDVKGVTIDRLVSENVCISSKDWDSFETSWDFKRHPLIAVIPKNSMLFDDISNIDLAECYMCWEQECNERFHQLKTNEEELNRIFIDIYGLQDELTPEVEDKDVTVRKADLQRDIRSLISYAVGCMFGRYSLNCEGLAYAGGEWDAGKYTTFPADKDNVIPICDDEYFEDDIVNRFVEFICTVYGEKSLESNLKFIADALGGKGQPRNVIRNYFLNDFYADHLKIYQKRPIYWLFDSGKKNGFKCLIYMHRYKADTIARIRTDYVHEQQARYRTAIAGLERQLTDAPTSERVRLNKQLTKLKDQAEETRLYEEKIHHLADQMIAIDLDDGVKVNYAKFADVLAKIK